MSDKTRAIELTGARCSQIWLAGFEAGRRTFFANAGSLECVQKESDKAAEEFRQLWQLEIDMKKKGQGAWERAIAGLTRLIGRRD